MAQWANRSAFCSPRSPTWSSPNGISDVSSDICLRLACQPAKPSTVSILPPFPLSRAHVAALAAGDGWIDRDGTILLFGPSGSGKSHLSAAFGHALIENGYRVLFTRTTDLVQRLQQARQALSLESAIEKLDKYHVLILEDLCYVRKDQAETSVLFELIAARYERRSLIVTANHPFGEWTSVFPDAAMTLAAVDRLVHHSTIFEMNVESYRRRVAAARAPRKPQEHSATARATARRREPTGLANGKTCSRSPLSFVT